MAMHRAVGLALAVLAGPLAACGGGTDSGAPSGPISFTRFDPAGSHVFVIDPAGRKETQLTNGAGVQAHSAWSPDGRRTAYSQVNSDGSSVMRINADGTGTALLNQGASWSMVPSWSPDGSRLAFTSDADGNYEIYTMAADGGDVRQVTFTDPPTSHVGPKYSPDGRQLLFAMQRPEDAANGVQDLWVVNLDGTSPTRLTNGFYNAESRSWSPDGRRIAFNAVIDGTGQIMVMQADGTGLRQITHNPGTTPVFSPGGVFPDMRGDVTPAWSPDGRRIAFASDRDGNYEIYTVNPDGTALERITSTPDQELSVGWSS